MRCDRAHCGGQAEGTRTDVFASKRARSGKRVVRQRICRQCNYKMHDMPAKPHTLEGGFRPFSEAR